LLTAYYADFFLTNVSPIFYIETLADLNKPAREGHTPEQEVSTIADKFPGMHGNPCSHHTDLCISNLLGHSVPMTGQIPLSQGRLVKNAGRSGAVFQQSHESEAFSRWQKNEFKEIERLYARSWRSALHNLDLREVAGVFRALGIDIKSCNTLQDASDLARATVHTSDKRSGVMALALRLLNGPRQLHNDIRICWRKAGYPSLFE
jgi:hypothetical protein